MVKKLRLIEIKGMPILEQLRLEEALLRADSQNFCLINYAAPPAIVMGISALPEELIDLSKVKKDKITLIKRFSGGGTVYIDEKTLFVTFIWQKEILNIPFFPQEIMRYSEKLYSPIFNTMAFALRENDYVIGEKKIGGNAQYFQKERFLHHTSFLWDFDSQKMEYLLQPKKQPNYRQNRSHHDFLTTLSTYFSSVEFFIKSLKERLSDLFSLEMISLEEAQKTLTIPHRKVTSIFEYR